MKNQANKQFNENGNALVLILITIILLAALTFTFMRGDSGSSTTTLTKGQAKIAASQIMKYAKSVENAVRKLQLVNGCSENEISFDNSVVAGYTNVNAPSDCWVFGLQGGGLSWQAPVSGSNDGSDWVYTGDVGVEYYNGAWLGKAELAIILPRVDKSTCYSMNALVGINHDQSDIPDGLNSIVEVQYTGSFSESDAVGSGTTDTVLRNAIQSGKKSFCFEEASTNEYFFIKTLINRE